MESVYIYTHIRVGYGISLYMHKRYGISLFTHTRYRLSIYIYKIRNKSIYIYQIRNKSIHTYKIPNQHNKNHGHRGRIGIMGIGVGYHGHRGRIGTDLATRPALSGDIQPPPRGIASLRRAHFGGRTRLRRTSRVERKGRRWHRRGASAERDFAFRKVEMA